MGRVDSHQQNGNPWLNRSPIGALYPLLPLKQAATELEFPPIKEAVKGHIKEYGVDGRRKRHLSYTMPENIPAWSRCHIQMK